jgi:SNF2 family DNA or RNA helicase
MAVWDVSQNVDRFKAPLGIVSAITPNGTDFASNHQRPLNGTQLLVLQGMPLDRLHFANESQKDRQNLAGNVMSTTVIGASLIAALICGHESLRSTTSSDVLSPNPNSARALSDSTLLRPGLMEQRTLEPEVYAQFDLKAFRQEAILSARMCDCEGNTTTSNAAIQTCAACGHAACTSCAGNPNHVYTVTVPSSRHRGTSYGFVGKWRPELPARLRLDSLPDISRLAYPASDAIMNSYMDIVSNAKLDSQYFCIGDVTRQDRSWKIAYNSSQATLELRVGRETQWLLFVKCPSATPGNSPLRRFLEAPIAQGLVQKSLLDVKWKLHIPCAKDYQLQIRSSVEGNRSWRSRLGLTDYAKETVPSKITIESNDQALTALVGDYDHLPHCGTASNSLYKRSRNGQSDLYFFLDPDPIGQSNEDCFVFSCDHSRKHYGDQRLILARMNSSWRPWDVKKERVEHIQATVSGVWKDVYMKLEAASVTLSVQYLSGEKWEPNMLDRCSQAIPVLDVTVQERPMTGTISDYSWALERPRILPSVPSWLPVAANTAPDCSCAPSYPNLLWHVDNEGKAKAQEDHKAAAIFERALKQRPATFQIEATRKSSETRIEVGINVLSLIHRAQGRFSNEKAGSTAWRLFTNHADLPPQPFPKFRLQSTAEDTPRADGQASRYLSNAQQRSLSWMESQELGKEITLNEIEEEIHPSLSWRVEARAQITRTVRGGVLADRPSFGKTVTMIGLIHNEFEQCSPQVLIQRNRAAVKLPKLQDSAATLVVCPPHIARQWASELNRFLGDELYNLYKVRVIEHFAQLKKLTIEDVLGSRVIIVAWTVFTEQEYITQLARFAAMPEPLMTSRRAFNAWMTRTVDEIPAQLVVHQNNTYAEFQQLSDIRLEDRLKHADFKATLPVRIQHGSAYQSVYALQSLQEELKSSKKSKPTAASKASTRKASHAVPLFHLFRFNRMVVDEYHYLDDAKDPNHDFMAVAIKLVAAHKRWVLSGTPALANFSDVDQIASFLGIRIGRYFLGDGTITTSSEIKCKNDQTRVESFLSQTEVMSTEWHAARHDEAQKFLDIFVRQNEADLDHITCIESLMPIELDAAHHAVYLELSQHLISQQMQIKKTSKKSVSDRSERVNESLNESTSAEEALVKSALCFETADGVSGLELLVVERMKQLHRVERKLLNLLTELESVMRKMKKDAKKGNSKEASIPDYYGQFKQDVIQHNWLGDADATQTVTALLGQAKSMSVARASKLKQLSDREIKLRLAKLRELSVDLVLLIRSVRFVHSIRDRLEKSTSNGEVKCSSPHCTGITNLDQLYAIPFCGHTACTICLQSRAEDEPCVGPGCRSSVDQKTLIRFSDLGSNDIQKTGKGFGKKLEAIAQLIKKLPTDDQAIIFAPNKKAIGILEAVFKRENISFLSLNGSTHGSSADIIKNFQTNKKQKFLVLDLGSESVAGV